MLKQIVCEVICRVQLMLKKNSDTNRNTGVPGTTLWYQRGATILVFCKFKYNTCTCASHFDHILPNDKSVASRENILILKIGKRLFTYVPVCFVFMLHCHC